MAVLFTTVAAADKAVSVEIGTFSVPGSGGNYGAWTVCTSWDKSSLYFESDTRSDYDLFIGSYRFDGRGDKAVIRIDDSRVRVGAFVPLMAGLTARLIAGSGPTRLDVWTPSIELWSVGSAVLSGSGWLRAHESNKPDEWVCVKLNQGRFSLSYNYNLREGGGDSICTVFRLF